MQERLQGRCFDDGNSAAVELIFADSHCIMYLQGALGLARLATTFFLKDELNLSPSELAALTGEKGLFQ